MALVGHLEEAGFALSVGTGEGTPLIAEELTFRQAFRDGAAVDPDEVFSGPRGVLVDVGGNPFLAGARLPLDEDHRVQLGGPAHDAQRFRVAGSSATSWGVWRSWSRMTAISC